MSAPLLVQAFQVQLRHKLEYKVSSKISHDAYLFKCFKFFDLHNNGYLLKNDFFKAIAKCGSIVDVNDIGPIFSYYDPDGTGKIDYKQFVETLLFQQNSEVMSKSILTGDKGDQSRKDVHSNYDEDENRSRANIAESRAQKQSTRSQQQHPEDSRASQWSRKEEHPLKESKIDRIYSNCETIDEIKDCINKHFMKNGLCSLLEFANTLKAHDQGHSHLISAQKLHDFLPFLSNDNITTMLHELSPNQYGEVDYGQFVYFLKRLDDPQRVTLLEETFECLDTKKEKEIQIEELLNRYKNSHNFEEYKRAIHQYCKFQSLDDGFFTDGDFTDFHEFLGYSLQSFEMFNDFIQKAYFEDDRKSVTSAKSNRSNRSREFGHPKQDKFDKLSQKSKQQNIFDFRRNKEDEQPQNVEEDTYSKHNFEHHDKPESRPDSDRFHKVEKKSQSNTSAYVKEVELIIIRIKKRLASKGTKGFLLLERALKNADSDLDGLVTHEEFKKVVKDQRIDITTTQCGLVFDVFDEQGTGYVNYAEFVYTLKGEIPANRKAYFNRMWQNVKLNEHSTNFHKVRQALNFRAHPDVTTGRRYEDDILKEIQETLLLIQDLNQKQRRETIDKQEFEEYFEHLSLSIVDDQLFESLMANFWKIISVSSIEDKYAGSRKLFDPTSKGYLMDHHRYAVKGGSVSQNAPFGTFSEPTNYLTEHHKL